MSHNPGCICQACKPRGGGGGLLDLPPCPVTGCDRCGSKSDDEDISWTMAGYGCSRCKGTDPFEHINECARLQSEAETSYREGYSQAIEDAAELAHLEGCWGTADRIRALDSRGKDGGR